MKQDREEMDKMTLAGWLIQLIDTPAWRIGKVTGMKHPRITQKEIDRMGKQELLEQAGELEKAGLLRADRQDFGTDVKQLHFSVDIMDELCRREGVENPRETLRKAEAGITRWRDLAPEPFILPYYDRLLCQTGKGSIPGEVKIPNLFRCLNAVVEEKEPVWKRVFSERIFHDSKTFEKKYEGRMLTILWEFSPKADDGMENHEILAEHGILTYSQQLALKGALKIQIGAGPVVDLAPFVFGAVLNAQTLTAARIAGIGAVRRVMTIENQANYESMEYREDTLYIFCHGFFSPKERKFLRELSESGGITFEHWGDMDYGGIRIFLFLKKKLFPGLRPFDMDRRAFEAAIAAGKGYPLSEGKRMKLEKIDAEELEDLKAGILERGVQIEQEASEVLESRDHKISQQPMLSGKALE